MRNVLLPILLPIALSACGPAAAAEYDSNNPVHCLTIFGVAGAAAQAGSHADAVLADELIARLSYIVHANGGSTWLSKVTPASHRIAAEWEAAQQHKQALQLFDECRGRQDADAEFSEFKTSFLRSPAVAGEHR